MTVLWVYHMFTRMNISIAKFSCFVHCIWAAVHNHTAVNISTILSCMQREIVTANMVTMRSAIMMLQCPSKLVD